MKKLFISMAIVCTYTYPAAQNSSIRQSHEVPDVEIINRSSSMTLFEQILTKSTKDLFFRELEQIRKKYRSLTDPKELIQVAYENIEDQSEENSEDLIAPYYFGLSIQDLINHNLMPEAAPGWWGGNIKKLDLSNMYINDLDGLQNIQSIQELSLAHNRLKDIPLNTFARLTDLLELNLDLNRLQTIQPDNFTDLVNLEALYLGNNQLQTIPAGTFADLAKLEMLFLNNNQFETIPAGAFAGLVSIKDIILKKNHITNLEEQHRIEAEIKAQNPKAQIDLRYQTPPPAPLTDDAQNAKRGRESISGGSVPSSSSSSLLDDDAIQGTLSDD